MLPRIRWMIRRDLDHVVKIEEEEFQYAWTEEDFLEFLRLRNNIGLVADIGGVVVGYIFYTIHALSLHIKNVAVSRQSQRRGIGRLMIEKIQGKLAEQRRHTLRATVIEDNLEAQLFFKAMGFRHHKTLFGHFDNLDRDGYVFSFDYTDLPCYQGNGNVLSGDIQIHRPVRPD
jgi:ribosomal-protein-alanine N-acetyltransferase